MERKELELDLLLLAIYRMSGFDFRQYMRSSIQRRVENRIRIERLKGITELTEKIIYDEVCLNRLINDFSINVTEMFRDPTFFEKFRLEVVPRLKQMKDIRIWHAGCSTGEEAYSMAILLKEEGLLEQTRIYATDINENVLISARKGLMPLSKMQAYTKNYILAGGRQSFSEYYTADSQSAYLVPSLLSNITFAQHNLVTDCSFNEFQVIICRNVLIYFDSALQNRVFTLFNESLTENGFLALGSKETLRTDLHQDFKEFVASEKIYIKSLT